MDKFLSVSLTKLAEQGIVGVVLALAIVGLVYLWKDGKLKDKALLDEKDKEIKDKETMNIVLRETGDAMKELLLQVERGNSVSREKTV